jgi:Protein of unknown function (DUF992)
MLRTVVAVLAGTAGAAVLLSAPASAAESLLGTLKCTAEVAKGDKSEVRDWKIECAFEPVKGQPQHYAGAINDPGAAPRESGKAFLVWNVLAAAPEVQSGMLVGSYKASGADGLVGGRNGDLILRPLTGPGQQEGINLAPRVSEIKLELPKV